MRRKCYEKNGFSGNINQLVGDDNIYRLRNTQIDIKGGSSVSVSSVHINLENSSDDTASVLSESASSVTTSSNKAFNSNKVTSSQMSTSSKEVYE